MLHDSFEMLLAASCRIDLSSIPNWLTTAGTFVLAYLAWKALDKWREEHVGKVAYDVSRRILFLIYQIQGLLWIEPIAYRGDQRMTTEEVLAEVPDVYIAEVRKQALAHWPKVASLIDDLRAEGFGAKAILGNEISERLRLLVSSLNALNPARTPDYKPTPEEMGGKKLTAEQFAEHVVRNATLSLPERIAAVEEELSTYLLGH
jgi:hypothetical protein